MIPLVPHGFDLKSSRQAEGMPRPRAVSAGLSVSQIRAADQSTPSRAQGVCYRQIVELPAATFFNCARLHAGLTTSACSDMWRAANEGRSERYIACRACPIGAAHAGVPNASRSTIRGALVCARCTRGATRLIGKRICISCYNREREFIRGRNARGMVPTKLAPLVGRRVFYLSNGRVHLVRSDRTASDAELIVATLRDAIHSVAFAWAGTAVRPGSVTPTSD
jgi:hypothetical protein